MKNVSKAKLMWWVIYLALIFTELYFTFIPFNNLVKGTICLSAGHGLIAYCLTKTIWSALACGLYLILILIYTGNITYILVPNKFRKLLPI